MKRRVRFALEAAALGGFKLLARLTPRPLFLRLGRALGWVVATVDRKHLAIARDNLFAVQFHPEKSAQAGLRLLANFAEWQP